MTTLTITLPDKLADILEERRRAEGYATAAEYIAAMIEKAAHRAGDQDSLVAALQEGLKGPFILADESFWEQQYKKYDERHGGSLPTK